MEQVFGSSLLSYVHENNGPIKDELLAKNILEKILSAVLYIKERGVVHRDMNPTNVFIDISPKKEGKSA